ncbi:hypothetical protein CC80DRAFT_449608, partial [Byssothecium circinans]
MTATPPDASQIPHPVSALAIKLAHQYAARIWTKTHPVIRLTNDDYIFVMISSILLLQTVWWGFGEDPTTLTLLDVETSYMYATIAEVFWTWAMSCTKISIAAILLRFEQVPCMRRFLWFMIGLLVLKGLYSTVSQTMQCVPLRFLWDFLNRTRGKCWSKAAIHTSALAVQIINIVSDWIFALLPISFLRKVQRPLRERVVVGVLMGLGIVASIASIVKVVYLAKLHHILESIHIGILSSTEALLVFVACCMPCLRVPLQRALEFLGLVTAAQRSSSDSEHGYG